MTAAARLQLSRRKGFNLQAHSRAINGLPAAKVDRATRWGNPWRVDAPIDWRLIRAWGWTISPEGKKQVCPDNIDAARRFAHALIWDTPFHQHVRDNLGGHNLACWCGLGEACHAYALLFVANSTAEEIDRLHYAIDQRIIAEAELLRKASLQ